MKNKPEDGVAGVVGPYSNIVATVREEGLPHSTCEREPWSEADQASWRASRAKDGDSRRANRRKTVAELALEPGLVFAVFDRVQNKEITLGTRALSRPERTLLFVKLLEFEVLNGGFHQFFFNTSGDCALQTLEALREIGHPALLDVYEKALGVFPASRPAEDRAVRNEQMSAIADEHEAWEATTDAFYMLEEIDDALDRYIRAHLNELDLPPE